MSNLSKFVLSFCIFASTCIVFFAAQTRPAFALAVCGSSCTKTTDCAKAAGSHWQPQCISGTCVNPNCPTDTTPGTICSCNTPTQTCGQPCGDWTSAGKGLLPLCKGESPTGCGPLTSACGLTGTYCLPTPPQNGYTQKVCSGPNGTQGYFYLIAPNGKPITTAAQVQAACPIAPAAPITPAAACMSITLSKTSPSVGDNVTLTCGQVTGVNHYEFRVRFPDSSIQLIAAGSAGSNVSQGFTVSQLGNFSAQCRICTGADASTCQPFESW